MNDTVKQTAAEALADRHVHELIRRPDGTITCTGYGVDLTCTLFVGRPPGQRSVGWAGMHSWSQP